ncbi:MAG: hypothetical protein E3K36_07855 [Candidatus Brocadia sp.]|nr:hypothetical protein [Candidatus Brocadia sp.]
MKNYLIPIFAFSITAAFGFACQVFAHETVDFNGTIEIRVGNEIIKEEVGGQVTVSHWGHGETNGNFDEAIFYFDFGPETTECGDSLDEETVRVSSYRENKYSVKTDDFPLDLSEDGIADVIERILNKYGKTVQNAIDIDECFSITDGSGTTGSGKILSYANRHIKGHVTINNHADEIHFKVKPTMKTFDAGFQNTKEHTLKIHGMLEMSRGNSHTH